MRDCKTHCIRRSGCCHGYRDRPFLHYLARVKHSTLQGFHNPSLRLQKIMMYNPSRPCVHLHHNQVQSNATLVQHHCMANESDAY